MITVSIRFFEELNDFLPMSMRKHWIQKRVHRRTSVKDLVESMGVPHTEIDLILADGLSVDFDYIPKNNDRITVYPMFESIDISGITRLRPEPLRDIKFVLDVHLGRLASLLRLTGFDALYRNDYSDETLAFISAADKRILLTRDRGLLKRKMITHGCLIRYDEPVEQLLQVCRRFDLKTMVNPFSRCPRCNGILEKIPKVEIEKLLKPGTRRYTDVFRRCLSCGKIYWKGAHYKNIMKIVKLMQNSGSADQSS